MSATQDSQQRGAREERDYASARDRLLRALAEQAGIGDEPILAAFASVPRHRFVPRALSRRAYEDSALPLALGQTISQPSMIAVMLHALRLTPEDRVLEIGAGSGYAAALLGELTHQVFAVEIIPELAELARRRISELGISNVRVFEGNGRHGLAAFGPFDRILVSAGSTDVPEDLLQQLALEGRIAIPVGGDTEQRLRIGTKTASGVVHWQDSVSCSFVPLIGHRVP